MPHPRAEIFWQIPTTGTYKITDARQMPGGEGMGTFGIDWAIKCYQLPIRLPVYSFRLSFRNCSSCVFLFFYLGVGQGGKRATALSQKQPCFRARSHESGYFWDCMFFLRHSTFRPHENNEPAHRNPKPKPETRNPHHFKTALQSVLRPNPGKKRAVSTGFQPRFKQTYSWS